MGGNFCFFGSRAELSQKNMKKAKKNFKNLLQLSKKADIIGELYCKRGGPLLARMNALYFKRRKKQWIRFQLLSASN